MCQLTLGSGFNTISKLHQAHVTPFSPRTKADTIVSMSHTTNADIFLVEKNGSPTSECSFDRWIPKQWQPDQFSGRSSKLELRRLSLLHRYVARGMRPSEMLIEITAKRNWNANTIFSFMYLLGVRKDSCLEDNACTLRGDTRYLDY